MKKLLISLLLTGALCFAVPASAVIINEWVSNDLSTDDYEFIELCGSPGESLDGLAIILIEGETSKGTIDRVIDLSGNVIPDDGYFVVGNPLVLPDLEMANGFIENGGNNIILVQDFSGSQGDDIDVDDDCVVDPGVDIGTIVDGVGYGLGFGAADCITYFGIVGVGPDITDTGEYDPAGGARCDGCDQVGGEWYMVCIGGTEPGGECFEDDGYFISNATPGGPNACSPVGNESTTWGGLKGMFR